MNETIQYSNSKERLSPIFPEVNRMSREGFVSLDTFVRIKRNGKWYVIKCNEVTKYDFTVRDEDAFATTYERLIKQVYSVILHYKIMEDFQTPSVDQREETERIPDIFKTTTP